MEALVFFNPFSKLEYHFERSYYTHNGECFKIQEFNRKYLLEFPIGFMKQFKQHEWEHSMWFNDLERAREVAQLIYQGKAGPSEDELPFSDHTHLVPIQFYLKLIPYFGKNLPRDLKKELKQDYRVLYKKYSTTTTRLIRMDSATFLE